MQYDRQRSVTRSAIRAIGAHISHCDQTHDQVTFPSESVLNKFYDIRYNLGFATTVHSGNTAAIHYDHPN